MKMLEKIRIRKIDESNFEMRGNKKDWVIMGVRNVLKGEKDIVI